MWFCSIGQMIACSRAVFDGAFEGFEADWSEAIGGEAELGCVRAGDGV